MIKITENINDLSELQSGEIFVSVLFTDEDINVSNNSEVSIECLHWLSTDTETSIDFGGVGSCHNTLKAMQIATIMDNAFKELSEDSYNSKIKVFARYDENDNKIFIEKKFFTKTDLEQHVYLEKISLNPSELEEISFHRGSSGTPYFTIKCYGSKQKVIVLYTRKTEILIANIRRLFGNFKFVNNPLRQVLGN